MKNKIIAVIGIIALSLIIINMSASHSKLSKTVDSKNVISMKTKKSEWILTRSDFDKGTFKNVTPTYLTNQVDGSDGFTITGTAKDNNVWNSSCFYCYMYTYLRWDYEIDFNKYNKLTFYAKMNEKHGIVDIFITDGLDKTDTTKHYLTSQTSTGEIYNGFSVNYTTLPTTWTKYEIDLNNISGKHIISFVGGYVDQSGSINSSTSYSDITFYN